MGAGPGYGGGPGGALQSGSQPVCGIRWRCHGSRPCKNGAIRESLSAPPRKSSVTAAIASYPPRREYSDAVGATCLPPDILAQPVATIAKERQSAISGARRRPRNESVIIAASMGDIRTMVVGCRASDQSKIRHWCANRMGPGSAISAEPSAGADFRPPWQVANFRG